VRASTSDKHTTTTCRCQRHEHAAAPRRTTQHFRANILRHTARTISRYHTTSYAAPPYWSRQLIPSRHSPQTRHEYHHCRRHAAIFARFNYATLCPWRRISPSSLLVTTPRRHTFITTTIETRAHYAQHAQMVCYALINVYHLPLGAKTYKHCQYHAHCTDGMLQRDDARCEDVT